MFDWEGVRTGHDCGSLFICYSEHFFEHLPGAIDVVRDLYACYTSRGLDRFTEEYLLRRRGAMAAHHLPTIILVAGGGCGFDPRRRY